MVNIPKLFISDQVFWKGQGNQRRRNKKILINGKVLTSKNKIIGWALARQAPYLSRVLARQAPYILRAFAKQASYLPKLNTNYDDYYHAGTK